MRYPVTITPDDGQFTVTFPDVPEVVTFGETREEARQRSLDALLTIFDALMKDRRDIPEPSRVTNDAIELPALESAKIELYRAMRARNIGKAELARRLDWHLPQVDRVLQVRHGSQLDQMQAAFAALGKKLVLTVVDAVHPGARSVGRRAKPGRVSNKPKQKSLGRSGVHPGVLRSSEAQRPHAAGSVTRGRHRTAMKAVKKR